MERFCLKPIFLTLHGRRSPQRLLKEASVGFSSDLWDCNQEGDGGKVTQVNQNTQVS